MNSSALTFFLVHPIFPMMSLYIFQIFRSLRGHLHFCVHFFFTLTGYLFLVHFISATIISQISLSFQQSFTPFWRAIILHGENCEKKMRTNVEDEETGSLNEASQAFLQTQNRSNSVLSQKPPLPTVQGGYEESTTTTRPPTQGGHGDNKTPTNPPTQSGCGDNKSPTNPPTQSGYVEYVKKCVTIFRPPFFLWIRNYDWKKNLPADFLAGITICVLLIPQVCPALCLNMFYSFPRCVPLILQICPSLCSKMYSSFLRYALLFP